jgi:hypothetical protein
MLDQAALVARIVAISFAAVLAVASLTLPRRARWALLPLLLCLMAYLARSAPQWAAAPSALLLPLSVGALLFPVAFWWLVHNAFEDRADLPWPVWLAVTLLLTAGLSSGRDDSEPVAAGHGAPRPAEVVAAGFVVAALWRLWGTAAQDLVSGRRVLRGWLLAYVGAHGLVVLAVELALRGTPAPAWLDAAERRRDRVALGDRARPSDRTPAGGNRNPVRPARRVGRGAGTCNARFTRRERCRCRLGRAAAAADDRRLRLP